MLKDGIRILKKLQELGLSYDLILSDYDIRDVLRYVPRGNLKEIAENVTGVAVKFDETGADFSEIWVTDSTFAPALDSVYERVR